MLRTKPTIWRVQATGLPPPFSRSQPRIVGSFLYATCVYTLT